jgi:hypothetical protein
MGTDRLSACAVRLRPLLGCVRRPPRAHWAPAAVSRDRPNCRLAVRQKISSRCGAVRSSWLGHKREHAQHVADLVVNDLIAAKGAAFIDILLLVGIVGAVLLSDRVGRIRLQIFGFIGCAAGLFIAAQSSRSHLREGDAADQAELKGIANETVLIG